MSSLSNGPQANCPCSISGNCGQTVNIPQCNIQYVLYNWCEEKTIISKAQASWWLLGIITLNRIIPAHAVLDSGDINSEIQYYYTYCAFNAMFAGLIFYHSCYHFHRSVGKASKRRQTNEWFTVFHDVHVVTSDIKKQNRYCSIRKCFGDWGQLDYFVL